MCQYLYAAFSLKSTAGPGLRAGQLEAVERWRRVIFAIAGEEMLHWAMVQNLLTAVGSAPYVSRPHMPHQAGGYPPGVQLRLLPFGEAALQHFVYLERPEGVEGADAEGFEPAGPAPPPMRPQEVVPRGQDFATQGHLYRSIERGFGRLADKLGEDRLFIGPAFQQADEAAFGWPDLGPITGLEGANRALERIVEQGEGATGDWAAAHYGRFLGVLEDYLAMRNTDPGFEPAHPVAAAGVRGVEGIEPAVYITDPATGGCSDLFNAVYELVLQMIARYFAFGHETPGQRQVLAHAAVSLMFQAIKPLGLLLARLPAGPDHPGATAGANFQLPYRASFLLPHRRSAWLRFAERLDELAVFAAGLHPPEGEDVVTAVSAALRRMALDLTAHVEAVLCRSRSVGPSPSRRGQPQRAPEMAEANITTKSSWAMVSRARGPRAARTAAMAASGGVPALTSKHAARVPLRPRPPMQVTTTVWPRCVASRHHRTSSRASAAPGAPWPGTGSGGR
jgi:Ferritin-like